MFCMKIPVLTFKMIQIVQNDPESATFDTELP